MTSKAESFLKRLLIYIYRVEDAILVGLLLLMIVLAVSQIALRNAFDTGLLWVDPFVRVLVLWIALWGAMIASRHDQHIRIDLVSRFLSPKLRCLCYTVVALFTAGICTTVAVYSTRFVLWEYEDGAIAFASVPVWVCESIMPFAFAIMALRYTILSLLSLRNSFRVTI